MASASSLPHAIHSPSGFYRNPTVVPPVTQRTQLPRFMQILAMNEIPEGEGGPARHGLFFVCTVVSSLLH